MRLRPECPTSQMAQPTEAPKFKGPETLDALIPDTPETPEAVRPVTWFFLGFGNSLCVRRSRLLEIEKQTLNQRTKCWSRLLSGPEMSFYGSQLSQEKSHPFQRCVEW